MSAQASLWAFWIFSAGLVGLCVGSFLNVVIHRLPRMMEADWQAQCAELRGEELPAREPFNLARPRSRCPHCDRAIRAVENIPVLSYLFLRGRCAGCGQGISPRYPLIETLTGLLSAGLLAHFGPSWQAIGALLLCWCLIALTFIDADTQLLPDTITLPLLWLGLLFNLFGTFTSLSSAVIGAMAGYLVLWSVYWAFKLATGREGMGYGDFKLLAALGAWLGWQAVLPIVLLASVIGAVVGIAMKLAGALREGRYVPFGPFLAGGGLVLMLSGTDAALAFIGWR